MQKKFLKTRREILLGCSALAGVGSLSFLSKMAFAQEQAENATTQNITQEAEISILDVPPTVPTSRIWYGEDVLQFGDWRKPEGKGPFPLAIVIHGGYWRSAYNLDHISHLCEALKDIGIATWSLEYRRIGNKGGAYPGTFQDIASGIDYVRELNAHCSVDGAIDLERVIVIGHSAGGHLAAWAGSRSHIPEQNVLASPHPLKLKGIVSLAGLLDLQYAEEHKLSRSATTELLKNAPVDTKKRYEFTSPIEMLEPDAPIVLIHGTKDVDVPIEISERYVAKCKSLNVHDVSYKIVDGADHYALIDPRSSAWETVSLSAVELLTQ